MMIKVSELEEEGLAISDPRALEPAFADPAWRLDALQLQISPDGGDVVVQGRLTATVPQTCGRCVESFPARVDVRVDVRLLPRPATGDTMELGADDLDVDFYTDDQVDLNRVVETETTLALPMKPLCREDCRGLCPTCGGNRNLVPCACPDRAPVPRLAPLRDLATRLRH
jgi:uncharacterized protein